GGRRQRIGNENFGFCHLGIPENENRSGPLEPSASAGKGERGEIFSLSPFLRERVGVRGSLNGEDSRREPLTRRYAPTSPRKNGERLKRETYAALASDDFISAKAQSIHCVSSATSLASTVAPHQMRRPAGASR